MNATGKLDLSLAAFNQRLRKLLWLRGAAALALVVLIVGGVGAWFSVESGFAPTTIGAFRAEAPTQVAAPIASGASSDTASRPCTSSPRAQSAGSVRTSTSDTRAATAPTQPRMGGQPSGRRCVIAVTCATAGPPVSRRRKWRVVRRGAACLQESEVCARHSG